MDEHIEARGHENVSATHASTFEVTSDDYLTPAGDCIVGIEADRVPADFDDAFVAACQSHDASLRATIEAEGLRDQITGSGHPELTFASDCSLVIRTSDYVDDRTVMVGADGAATDLDRDLIGAIAAGADVRLTVTVE